MEQKNLFRAKGFIIVAIIVITTVVIIGLYWLNNRPDQSESTLNPSTNTILPVIDTAALSPISPISAISPVASAVPGKTDPAELEALVQQGIALYENRDYQGALKIFDDALNLDPNNALAYNARGSVYIELQNYDKAIADYTKAIESDTLFPHAYYNRGRAYNFLKQYDKAIADLQYSAQLAPAEFSYRANGNIGLIYHQQGQYDQALEAFATAMSANDSKADTYYLRGETYTAMENYEAAISDYQAAISRFPNYYQAYQSLGYAYYKTGQFDQAVEALNKAIELSPDSPAAHFYLSLVYLATDQADKAQAEVSQAMKGIGALAEEDQNLLYKRVLGDLEIFAKESPEKAKDVETLTNLIPPPQ